MRGGFIKLYRALRSHPLWRGRFDRGRAWIDLLLCANFKDGKVMRGNRFIPVRRGQAFTSQQELANRWGWDRKTVRAFLKALESDGMITIETSKQTDTGYTLITIQNYERFQGRGREGLGVQSDIRTGIQAGIESPSKGHRIPTSKKGKKSKKEDNVAEEGGKEPLSPAAADDDGARAVDALLTFYRQEFEQRFGACPPSNKKDPELIRGLLGRYGPDLLQEFIRAYVKDRDPFLTKRGHPLALLTTRIGAYIGIRSRRRRTREARVAKKRPSEQTSNVEAADRFIRRHERPGGDGGGAGDIWQGLLRPEEDSGS